MADEGRRIELHGLTYNQAQTGVDWINGLDQTGTSAVHMEYTPAAGNPEIDQNVFRINVVGPDIAAFVTRVRNKIQQQLGTGPDVDEDKSGDLEAIRVAWQTYGEDIANRADLKAALKDIAQNGARCMSAEDTRTLNRWIKNKGFNNRQELRDWLNETP